MATPIYLAYQLLSLVPWNNYFLLCCLCYFLLYLYVFFELLLHRPMTIWNLFVLYDKEEKINVFNGDVIYASLLQ